MMNKTYYFLTRQRKDSEQLEFANYNDYSNTLSWQIHQDYSTRFDELEQLEQLKDIAEQLNRFDGEKYTIKIVKLTETMEEV